MIDGIGATAVIDVSEGVADHPDAPTVTRMPMLRVEVTEIANAKIDMEVLAVIVESGNGTAIGVLGGNTVVTMAPGLLDGNVMHMETIAVVVLLTGETVGTVVAEIAMRISLRKTAVVEARRPRRSANPRQILPT